MFWHPCLNRIKFIKMSKEVNDYLEGTSRTFRVLYKMNLVRDKQKRGNITVWGFIKYVFKVSFGRLLFTYAYKGYLLEPLNKKFLRPRIWRFLGCEVGKNVHIGHFVRMDFGNPERIHLGDDVVLSNGVTILCHKRDISGYSVGDKATLLPFKYEDVTLEKGCQIGLNCTILPGVTVGEGSIVGSGALVTKDIPAWSVAVGCPAKIVRTLSVRPE